MSNETEAGGYGYVDPEAQIDSGGSALVFGLNPKIRMTKFEWIANGGAAGAEQEALDIIINVNGSDKGIRLFPVTKAFLKAEKGQPQEETTDPKSAEMKEAFTDLNAILTQIMHCYVSKEDLITALSVPIANFKAYITILMGLLPANYPQVDLDGFAQYQWQIKGESNKTYLQFPSKMKYGKWLIKAVEPMKEDGTPGGTWTEHRKENPADGDTTALYYQDQADNVHPFIRNGWFVNSNFANQQKEDGGGNVSNSAMSPSAPSGEIPPATTAKGW